MQCTNQDQYRTIYTMSVSVCVCECVLAFDILIYLFHAHNGLVGWMACSFRYFHPNPPRMPSNHSNSQFPRWREKKRFHANGKEKRAHQQRRRPKIARYEMQCYAQSNIITYTQAGRQKRQASEWQDPYGWIYMLCAHNKIHTHSKYSQTQNWKWKSRI